MKSLAFAPPITFARLEKHLLGASKVFAQMWLTAEAGAVEKRALAIATCGISCDLNRELESGRTALSDVFNDAYASSEFSATKPGKSR